MIKKVGNALMLYASMLVPRSKKICVFGAWFGQKFSDNPKYLYLYLQEKKNIKVVWITKNSDLCRALNEYGIEAYMHNSIKGIYYQLRAGYVFICTSIKDINEYLVGNAIIVNLFHGVGLKKFGYDDKISTGNSSPMSHSFSLKMRELPYRKKFYVATSEKYVELYGGAFGAKRHQMLKIGQPRNDIFYHDFVNDIDKDVFSEEKIILYMPTHRNEGKTKMHIEKIFDMQRLNDLCYKYGYKFVIKKHFYHGKEPKISNDYSNIIEITGENYDTQRLLKCANVLITDYSSVYIDFLLLNRPVIFYYYDLDNYLLNDREMYFAYDEVTPGYKTDMFSNLYFYLEKYMKTGEDGYEVERERVCSLCYSSEARGAVSPIFEKMLLNDSLIKIYKENHDKYKRV